VWPFDSLSPCHLRKDTNSLGCGLALRRLLTLPPTLELAIPERGLAVMKAGH
jgi:hypothetical protein